MRKITVKTISGKKVEFEYGYKKEMVDNIVDSDGHLVNIGKKPDVKETITIYGDDRVFNATKHLVIDVFNDKVTKTCKEYGVDTYFKSGSTVFIFPAEELSIIKEVIAKEREEGTSKEVVGAEMEKKKAEYTDNMRTAEIILSRAANTTIKNADGSFYTREQAKIWKDNYNNAVNEGGKGYVPYVVTVEDVAWANAVLSEEE